jgi:hypothetical protein
MMIRACLQLEVGQAPPAPMTPSHHLVLLHCLKHQWHTTKSVTTQVNLIQRLGGVLEHLLLDTEQAGFCPALSMPGTPTPSTPSGTSRVAFTFPSVSAPGALGADRAVLMAGGPGRVATGTTGMLTSTRSSFLLPSKQASMVAAPTATAAAALPAQPRHKPSLLAKAYFYLAQWQQAVAGKQLDEAQVCDPAVTLLFFPSLCLPEQRSSYCQRHSEYKLFCMHGLHGMAGVCSNEVKHSHARFTMDLRTAHPGRHDQHVVPLRRSARAARLGEGVAQVRRVQHDGAAAPHRGAPWRGDRRPGARAHRQCDARVLPVGEHDQQRHAPRDAAGALLQCIRVAQQSEHALVLIP